MIPISEITTHDDSVSAEIENNPTKEHAPTGAGSPHYCAVIIEWFDAFHDEFPVFIGDTFPDA